MKKTNASILVILLAILPTLGLAQNVQTICLSDATAENRFYCLPTKDVIDLLANSEVLICKIDSLENNQTVKNCILLVDDNTGFTEAFVSSGINNPKVEYVEFIYCGHGFFIQSTPESREEQFIFWDKVDKFLEDLDPTNVKE